jgi:hypothetical protein
VVAHRPQPAAPIAAAHVLKNVLTQNSSGSLVEHWVKRELVARLLDRGLDGLVIEASARDDELAAVEVDMDVSDAADRSDFLTDRGDAVAARHACDRVRT